MTEKKDISLGNLSPAMNCRAIFKRPYGMAEMLDKNPENSIILKILIQTFSPAINCRAIFKRPYGTAIPA